ncbi:MAG TPA: PHB depolymerase family esterase [Bacteroidales bacterium]|nr:PHB depolymerase family esterase [Bacteroidales bacterium]
MKKPFRSFASNAWSALIRGISFTMMLMLSLKRNGGHIRKLKLDHGGIRRTCKLYIPDLYDESKAVSLVIVLHGRGGNGDSMILITKKGFNRLANKDMFIVAYPDAVELNWNDGRKDEQSHDRAHRENIDDVGFISALIDEMMKIYKIDSARIYVTGISNGAIMCYRLACELSHLVAAIAPVDGNIPVMLYPECSPSMPVSVLAINNTDDPLVPFSGGDIHDKFNSLNLGKVLSVDESIAFWIRRNGCSTIPVAIEIKKRHPEDKTRVNVRRYINEHNGAEVVLYTIDGGGHTWPGGLQYLPVSIIGKTCRDFDANEVIWSFFRNHSKPIGDTNGKGK